MKRCQFFISYVIIIWYIVGQYLQRGYLNESRIDDSKKIREKKSERDEITKSVCCIQHHPFFEEFITKSCYFYFTTNARFTLARIYVRILLRAYNLFVNLHQQTTTTCETINTTTTRGNTMSVSAWLQYKRGSHIFTLEKYTQADKHNTNLRIRACVYLCCKKLVLWGCTH